MLWLNGTFIFCAINYITFLYSNALSVHCTHEDKKFFYYTKQIWMRKTTKIRKFCKNIIFHSRHVSTPTIKCIIQKKIERNF